MTPRKLAALLESKCSGLGPSLDIRMSLSSVLVSILYIPEYSFFILFIEENQPLHSAILTGITSAIDARTVKLGNMTIKALSREMRMRKSLHLTSR